MTLPTLLKKVGLPLISLVMLAGTLWYAGVGDTFTEILKLGPAVMLVILVLLILNILCVTVRLQWLLSFFHLPLSYGTALRANLKGLFASLFFSSLFGQVVGRQVELNRQGASPTLVASLTAIERIVLFFVGATTCILGIIWLLDIAVLVTFLQEVSLGKIIVGIIVCFSLSFWAAKPVLQNGFFQKIVSVKKVGQFVVLSGITMAAQALVFSCFVLAGWTLDSSLNIIDLIAAAAVVSFAASLPFSINGWGVREFAALIIFGQIGMEASSALALSVFIGIAANIAFVVMLPLASSEKETSSKRIMDTAASSTSMVGQETENILTWLFVFVVGTLIFFHVHLPIGGTRLNVNLADPFIMLALAVTAIYCLTYRHPPYWRIPFLNLALILIGVLIGFSFLYGWSSIGFTSWAFTGRVLGWFVIIGYLTVGILIAQNLGQAGIRILIGVMIISCASIVVIEALWHQLDYYGFVSRSIFEYNFQGMAMNRNTFAFQLLVCSALIIAFTDRLCQFVQPTTIFGHLIQPVTLLSMIYGLILAGLFLTGSRAGIITWLLALPLLLFINITSLRFILLSLLFGLLFWVVYTYTPTFIGLLFAEASGATQSIGFSLTRGDSDILRWDTMYRAFELWLQNPIFGTGLGYFVASSTDWYDFPVVIHSTPLWVLAEMGLIGAIVLGGTVLWIIWHLFKNNIRHPEHAAAFMLIIYFLVFGLLHDIFYQRIFWLVLGVCLALPFTRKEETKLKDNTAENNQAK